ncbi:hypothetical protein AB4254_08815 [Vibrio breoganii]
MDKWSRFNVRLNLECPLDAEVSDYIVSHTQGQNRQEAIRMLLKAGYGAWVQRKEVRSALHDALDDDLRDLVGSSQSDANSGVAEVNRAIVELSKQFMELRQLVVEPRVVATEARAEVGQRVDPEVVEPKPAVTAEVNRGEDMQTRVSSIDDVVLSSEQELKPEVGAAEKVDELDPMNVFKR